MEKLVKHQTGGVQDGLVKDYCMQAEGRIMTAGSRADAMHIKEDWCMRFRSHCESALVVNAVSAYLDQIVARRWKQSRV